MNLMNSTFIESTQAGAVTAQLTPVEQNTINQQQQRVNQSSGGICDTSINSSMNECSNRNSKLIYLNPSDYIPAAVATGSAYGTNLNTNYSLPMNRALSSGSTSPNHYSNSSTSSTSGDLASSSSDCPASSNQSSTYASPPVDFLGESESPYRLEPTVVNGSIYQTLKRIDNNNNSNNRRASLKHGTNYLECIDQLINEDEEMVTSRVSSSVREEMFVNRNQPIYSNKIDLLTRNRYKNYEDHSDINRSKLNSVSFRAKPVDSSSNQKLLTELLRSNNKTGSLRPVPPSRTSSLQYRNRTMHPSASLFIYNKKANNNQTGCHSNSSSDGDESSAILENCHQNPDDSIYSSFSLRMSRLSSFNLGVQNEPKIQSNTEVLLNKGEQFRIESFYKSIGSSIYSSKCAADLYTTDLQCLIKLLDWQHQFNGVPVWVFNTGLNPKRPKGLSLIIADQKTGFANLKLNKISHNNDLKWTKPGHLTLKIFPENIPGHLSQDLNSNSQLTKKQLKNRLKQSATSDHVSTLRRDPYSINQSFNTYSELISKLSLGNNDKEKFVFAALRFNSEFECSKFYDFYRNLFVDSQNDDLFNPHYSKPAKKLNVMKVFLKKITKSSISSPVAFQHVNSISMMNENRESCLLK